jgi:hypothetical protein
MNVAEEKNYIASIIGNPFLAESIYENLKIAEDKIEVLSEFKIPVNESFELVLNNAIRNIEEHPRGKLFQRLIDYGPLNPDETDLSKYPTNTYLSDDECILAVNFSYSHIINRFKGDLAELLAIKPITQLKNLLASEGIFDKELTICLGDYIKEYQETGNLAKGADGLIVEIDESNESVRIKAVIEIKSMYLPQAKMIKQMDKHICRLRKGLQLGTKTYEAKNIIVDKNDVIKIMVIPSSWKINREYSWQENKMVSPEADKPLKATSFNKIENNVYQIVLDWSQEALEQAAYEMTYNYMAEVGRVVYESKELPKGWEGMSPEEAGYNSIKEKLYYIMLRALTKRQGARATKLYNVYCFGYPLGIDSKEMLWPEDFKTERKYVKKNKL